MVAMTAPAPEPVNPNFISRPDLVYVPPQPEPAAPDAAQPEPVALEPVAPEPMIETAPTAAGPAYAGHEFGPRDEDLDDLAAQITYVPPPSAEPPVSVAAGADVSPGVPAEALLAEAGRVGSQPASMPTPAPAAAPAAAAQGTPLPPLPAPPPASADLLSSTPYDAPAFDPQPAPSGVDSAAQEMDGNDIVSTSSGELAAPGSAAPDTALTAGSPALAPSLRLDPASTPPAAGLAPLATSPETGGEEQTVSYAPLDTAAPPDPQIALPEDPATAPAGSEMQPHAEWIVNVAVHPTLESAQAQVQQLVAQGFNADVRQEMVRGRTSYRVVIEGIPTEVGAQAARADLESRFGLDSAWVLRKY